MSNSTDFEVGYNITMEHEGSGRSNRAVDRGGDTYRGITRKNFPKCEVWKIIDSGAMDTKIKELDVIVKQFYYENFWNVVCREEFPLIINVELFDSAVNFGTGTVIKWLQRSLNILNRCHTNYTNMDVDGVLGATTIKIMNQYLAREKNDGPRLLHDILNLMQGSNYIRIVEGDETQEYNLRGWLKRVKLYESL